MAKRKKSRKRRKARPKARPRKPLVIEGHVEGSKGDPLDFQLTAKVRIPKGRKLNARVLTEAIRYRIETGRNPKGIQLRVLRWKNPARKDPAMRGWRHPTDPETRANAEKMGYGPPMSPQQAAWRTLSNALGAVQVADFTVRRSRGA